MSMAASVCFLLTSRALLHHFKASLRTLCLRRPKANRALNKCFPFYHAVGYGGGGGPRPVPLLADSPSARNPLFLSLSSCDLSIGSVDGSVSDPGKGLRLWDPAGEIAVSCGVGGGRDFCGRDGTIWTVVILGWLGAKKKHLKMYADFYTSRGIRSVRFVLPLWEALALDLGRRMEEKIAVLATELVDWCSESERDGKERHLLFHTFSNTGWLVYGSILMNLQSRGDVMGKIKGCIIDSGPAPDINPKVWAAGFCAALMKRRSSTKLSHELINGDSYGGNNNTCGTHDWKSSVLETITMFILESFFTLFLILPVVERKLGAVISILSKQQPSCPQLYLYSSADRVIPASSVESFVKEQKSLGRAVCSHDFCTSPHVDHFRCFRHVYSSELDEFLNVCCAEMVCASPSAESILRSTPKNL